MRWAAATLLFACNFTVQPAGSSGPDGAADAPGDGDVVGDGGLDGPADARADAAPPPDAAFDPATCPAGYATTIAAAPASRYRWIAVNRTWPAHRQDCEDDLVGATHLVVLDSAAEAQQIAAASSSMYYHVGAAQAPNQASVQAGWTTLTGEPVPASMWHAGQPNDSNGSENDQQDRASVNTLDGPLLQDVEASFSTHAVCECDGKPVVP